jgi:hypothetical protein
MKTGVERDELVLAGVEPGQFHGALDGLGAAVAEKCLGQPTGCDLGNLFCEVGYRLHVINVGRTVDQLLHLCLRRRDDVGIAVAGVDHGDAGKAIEIFTAIDVSDDGAAGFVDHNRHD